MFGAVAIYRNIALCIDLENISLAIKVKEMFGLLYPGSTIIDHIPDRITEDSIARSHSNDLVMHLVVGYFFEDNIQVPALLDDQIALSDVQLEQPIVEVQQSEPEDIIHDLLQLARESCLY